MNTEYKKLWVNALRSGLYKQGKFALENSNHENCCLGVLCRTLLGANPDAFPLGIHPASKSVSFDDNTGLLSERIMQQVGITEEQQHALQYLNDHSGKSFSQIADYIEKNL